RTQPLRRPPDRLQPSTRGRDAPQRRHDRRADSLGCREITALADRLVEAAAAAAKLNASSRSAALRTLFDYCGCVRAGANQANNSWQLDVPGYLAVLAHLRDQDDLHLGSVTHPGGIVWSAVCACALERDITLGEACASAALGYELIVRLAECLG